MGVKQGLHLCNEIQAYIKIIITVWQVIFVGVNFCDKSSKASRSNFRGFKYRGSNVDYVIYHVVATYVAHRRINAKCKKK